MYTSKEFLHNNLGIDLEIATFFVDRNVPVNNKYWKGRYLYVASGTGYLFIPLFFDLTFKLGIPKAQLLDPLYIQVCESILHSAALHEYEEISLSEHIENCTLLVTPYIRNQALFDDLNEYFRNQKLRPYKYLGTFSKALNRADSFLFALSTLQITESLLKKTIEQWYALIPSFLLLDDITDLKEDRQKDEENAIGDFAPGTPGVQKAIDYLRLKFSYMKSVNQQLGEFFERSLERSLHTPYLQSILNSEYGA